MHGRNASTWEDRLAFDVWYVEHWSIRLDLQILRRTLGLVIRREGTSPSDALLMPEFLGSAGHEGSS